MYTDPVMADGCTYVSRICLLQNMREVCAEENIMRNVFSNVSGIKRLPVWPLEYEAFGYFKELVCDMAYFRECAKILGGYDYEVDEYIANLWLKLFEAEYGVVKKNYDGKECRWAIYVNRLRDQYSDKAAKLEPEFMKILSKGNVTIVWGLYIGKAFSVECFVNGRLYHPTFGEIELPHMGWGFSNKFDKGSLLNCLKGTLSQAFGDKIFL